MHVEYFILTRFNLRLWPHDKWGKETQTTEWLAHRVGLFEKYCLPSVAKQTCKDFVWITLMDEATPDEYKAKMEEYRIICPQLTPIYVQAKNSRNFTGVFMNYLRKNVTADRVISTYFDNDDALNLRFVEQTRALLERAPAKTFLYFDGGVQYLPSIGLANRIKDSRNHFVSVVEDTADSLMSIYGYGSHYYVEDLPDANVYHYTLPEPMWCEVAHGRNKVNDAYYLFTAHPAKDSTLLIDQFGIPIKLKKVPWFHFIFQYVPRYLLNVSRRAVFAIRGRPWWK